MRANCGVVTGDTACGGDQSVDHGFAADGLALIGDFIECSRQTVDGRLGYCNRRAVGKLDRSRDVVRVNIREHLELEKATFDQAQCNQQQCNGASQRYVAATKNGVNNRMIHMGREPFNGVS